MLTSIYQLMTVPPYAIAFVLTITSAVFSERTHRRAPFILATTTIGVIGYIILLSSTKAGVSYFGTILAAAGIYPSTAIVLAWSAPCCLANVLFLTATRTRKHRPANNVSGQTKRAVSNALQISVGNLGAVIGTQLYRPAMAPRYFVGHGFACGYMTSNIVVVLLLWWVLNKENRMREEALESLGEVEIQLEHAKEGDGRLTWRFQV